jgi:hypothetical protein
MRINKLYFDFFKRSEGEPFKILQGSRRSGKTIAILQHLFLKLAKDQKDIIQIVAKTNSLVETGVLQDWKDLVIDDRAFLINQAKKEYKYGTSLLKFLSINKTINAADIARTMGKATARYLNECNNFEQAVADNLIISTGNAFDSSSKSEVLFDYNPTKPFWITDYINDNNFLKTTWRDNYRNLSKLQIDEFMRWEELGQKSVEGSAHYWRYQVYCLGNYAGLFGEIFTRDNIKFTNYSPKGFPCTIFIDPATMHGFDSLAMTLCCCCEGKLYVLDSFSKNEGSQLTAVEVLKKWHFDHQISHCYCETNGEISKNFYNLLISNNVKVMPYFSKNNKFDRIMAHYDFVTSIVIFVESANNQHYVKQIYEFSQDCENEDNIDCIVSQIMLNLAIGNIRQKII